MTEIKNKFFNKIFLAQLINDSFINNIVTPKKNNIILMFLFLGIFYILNKSYKKNYKYI